MNYKTFTIGELYQELIKVYDGHAGEILLGLQESDLSQIQIKKCLINYIIKSSS